MAMRLLRNIDIIIAARRRRRRRHSDRHENEVVCTSRTYVRSRTSIRSRERRARSQRTIAFDTGTIIDRRTYNGTCYNTAITRDVVQQITDESNLSISHLRPLSLSLTRNCSDDFGHHNHITTYSYGLASLFFSQAQRNIKGSSFLVEASSPMMTASSSSSPSSSPMMTASSSSSPSSSILDFLDL